ncbi:TonB-dependent receptor plug domain-containing protein [Niabella aquatica]
MKKGFISIIGLLHTLAAVQKINAQEQTLDPVTVTSSLAEKRISETGRNITIIRGDDISKLPVHSLDELLKYIPGLEIQSRGPQGSQSDISIRGGTFQQVLVILDGLRLNDPNTGHFTAYIPLTPAQIDRIEVLKGASAAVYGSDAVGGVINIITKSSGAVQKDAKVLQAQVGAGEYNLVNTSVGGFWQAGRLSADAGILSNHSTGVLQRGTRGYFHNTSVSAGFRYQLNRYWNISARTAYDNRDFAAQNFYTTSASDTASETVRSWWHQLKVGFEKKRSKLSVNAGYKTLNDAYAFNSVAPANQNTSKLFQSLLLFQQQLAENTLLTTGLNYQHKTIVSNDRGNHSLNIAAPFAGISQQIGRNLNLLPSVRIEFIGENKAEWLPQLNASLHISNWQMRASGGRTIRDADFTERYNNYGKSAISNGQRVGYPGLVPEVSWNYEAGFDWFYQSRFRLSSTFFQRFHSRLIDWISTPYADMPRKDNLDAAGTYALAKNIAEVSTTGFETDAQYLGRINDKQRLVLNGGVVWLYSSSSEAAPSFYISSHARFLSNFNIQYEAGNWALGLTGIYKSRNPQQASPINAFVSKDYFVLNGRGSYSFIQKRLAAFIQVDNIFDRNYSDLLGAPMPGRWLQGGISFNMVKVK